MCVRAIALHAHTSNLSKLSKKIFQRIWLGLTSPQNTSHLALYAYIANTRPHPQTHPAPPRTCTRSRTAASPCALVNVKLTGGEEFLVAGQEVTAFTNAEEDYVKLREVVPWTCQDKLTERGAKHVDGGVFKPQVCLARDGRLITGQNPPSAAPLGEAIVAQLKKMGKL